MDFTFSAVQTTLGFSAPSTLNIQQTPYSLTATSSAALPYEITSSTPSTCTVSGTSLQLVSLGTCTVTATQPQTGIYAAASVTRSIEITKVSQAVSFTPPTLLTMVQSPQSLSATASSGLPVALTSSTTSVCEVLGATLTLRAPGWCTVTAFQDGNGVYASASVTKSITVTKEAQVIAFAPPSAQTMAQSPVSLVATATSGLPVSLASSTPTVCAVDGTSLTLLSTGTCSITASQPGDGVYSAATSVGRSISVTKTAQTVTFSPALTAVATDDPVTLSASSTSGLPVAFSTSTPNACVVGGRQLVWVAGDLTCTVTATQAGNDIYAAASVTRSITVSKAAQVVTFNVSATNVVATDQSMTLAASASSGLSVAISTSTPSVCSVTGTEVSWVSGDADCVLIAMQVGDERFALAASTQRIRVVKATQFITLEPLPPVKLTGDPPSVVRASSSRGLAVQITTSTPTVCTVDGNTLTSLEEGDCFITVSQPGNAIQAAAAPVTAWVSIWCSYRGPCRLGVRGPGGGIVFYDAGSEKAWGRYLEAAPAGWAGSSSDPQVPWCSTSSANTYLSTQFGIGVGMANTVLIKDPSRCGDSSAAGLAALYRGGGKNDWFLPSESELYEMYAKRAIVGGLSVGMPSSIYDRGNFYWASTEIWSFTRPNGPRAEWLDFYKGSRYGSVDYDYKSNGYRVRPIRAF
ncbi:MAG: hypothetical protein KGN78_14205 [Actinomycetales bacterium]|nr:hypothetical protein [Actinomycetales bacterium]